MDSAPSEKSSVSSKLSKAHSRAEVTVDYVDAEEKVAKEKS